MLCFLFRLPCLCSWGLCVECFLWGDCCQAGATLSSGELGCVFNQTRSCKERARDSHLPLAPPCGLIRCPRVSLWGGEEPFERIIADATATGQQSAVARVPASQRVTRGALCFLAPAFAAQMFAALNLCVVFPKGSNMCFDFSIQRVTPGERKHPRMEV